MCIPLKTCWNIELLSSLLQGYEDSEVVQWLTYGWPISRPPNWEAPQPTFENHGSANSYPEVIDRYIDKEKSRGAVCRPFRGIPFHFTDRIGVSPLSTRPKRDSQEHRIIMDLSWPPGKSVNDGIGKDQFMEFHAKLSFPTVDAIALRVAQLASSQQVYMFKIDLSGYFRQLPLDPGDYSLLCFVWRGQLYFDIVSPMGLRSAPYFAQRTSDAIRYIHNAMGYFLFNDIDDLIGVEGLQKINSSFQALLRTLKDIGLKEAQGKRVEPTQVLNCMGTLVNAADKTLSVLPERTAELMTELKAWYNKDYCTIKELQRLVGKLQFVCAVVRPSRLFMSCMLELLRSIKGGGIHITEEFRKDIMWWIGYLPIFTGTSILWM